MGREYDSLKQYKVEELINFHLIVYNQHIDSILSSAIEAYGVEHRFRKIQSFWMEREFKLSEHLLGSAQKSGQNVILLSSCYFYSVLCVFLFADALFLTQLLDVWMSSY